MHVYIWASIHTHMIHTHIGAEKKPDAGMKPASYICINTCTYVCMYMHVYMHAYTYI